MTARQDAAFDLKYLLDRGYPKTTALNLVVNHHHLSIREKNFLHRYVYSDEDILSRRGKKIPLSKIRGKTVVVDGYNVLITTEAVLEGKGLVAGMDGFLRDTSAVFSGYRFTERTKMAVKELIAQLSLHKPAFVLFIFDSQMSGSGNLASYVRRKLSEAGLSGDARTSRCADAEISEMDEITATSDGVIIGRVERVVDICSAIHKKRHH
jgi:hypothetical protein